MESEIEEQQAIKAYGARVKTSTTLPYHLYMDIKKRRWKMCELLELGYTYKIHGDNVMHELQESNEKLSQKIQLIASREFAKEQEIFELKKALGVLQAKD